MKKIISLALCFCLALTSVSFGADTARSRLEAIKSQSSNVSNAIKQKRSEVAGINQNIANIENKITESENKIANMEAQIAVLTNNIQKAGQDIKTFEKKIDVNSELLGKRINVMYKKGDITYIEIVFDSKNFSELLSNFKVISDIVDYDRKLLAELKETKDTIAAKKVEMEENKNAIAKLKTQIEAEKRVLESNEKQQQAEKALITKDIDKLQIQEDELLKQAKALETQIKQMTAKSSVGAVYKGGVMGWPLAIQGTITSPFGYRSHPLSGKANMHTGLDIAAPKGTSVLAAADGVVIASSYAGSYGNMVMIDHGGGIVTLYAHNSALVATKGTKVTRGTVIAKVGTTGASTGNHLHFEVRVNGKFVNPRNYV